MSDRSSEAALRKKANLRRGTFTVRAGASPSLVRDPRRHYRLHRCLDEIGNTGDCDVVMTQSAYQQIMKHLEADTTREHGGLLLGYLCRSRNATPATVWIVSSLPAEHTKGSPTSLTFSEDTWLKFQQQTDELEHLGIKLQRLGWYHSHPGMEVFLSAWDLDVCTNFDSPHHVALVVDPIRNRGGFFIRGEHGYRQHEPRGFWECPDQKPESLIQWENTFEIRSEWMIPASELLPVEYVEEPDVDFAIPGGEPQPEARPPEPAPEESEAGGPGRESIDEETDQTNITGTVKSIQPTVNEESSSTKKLSGNSGTLNFSVRKTLGFFWGKLPRLSGNSGAQKTETAERSEETPAPGPDGQDREELDRLVERRRNDASVN
jgi:proteasome lid subunit RPN8/RPN11